MPAEGLLKGTPPWELPERVSERWVSAFSWEVPKVVAEAATPLPWNMEAMLGLNRHNKQNSFNSMQYTHTSLIYTTQTGSTHQADIPQSAV